MFENKLPVRRVKELIRADDPGALDLIYDVMGSRLYRYILGMLGSVADTEDVFQELFVRIAKNRRKLLDADNPTAYLFGMARNLTRNFIIRRPRRCLNIEDVQDSLADNPVNLPEDYTRLMQFLMELPLKQREVISMKCLENMTFEEIAGVLNVSINTAASRYRYALEKLRKKINREKYEK